MKYISNFDRFALFPLSKLISSQPIRQFSMMEISCLQSVRYLPPVANRRSQTCSAFIRCGIMEPGGEPAPMGQKTKYKDGLFEKAFMSLFARKMDNFSSPSGKKKNMDGGLFDMDYESFVDVSRSVMMGRNRKQQQEIVREVLMSMLPPGAPAQFRKLFPPTKWSAEFNAALTVPFFQWLVGPSEAPLRVPLQKYIDAFVSVPWILGLQLNETQSE